VDTEAKAELDTDRLFGMENKLSGVVFVLIAWAVVITIGIAIMVGLIYKRMRRQQSRKGEGKSALKDTESGSVDSTTRDSPSIIMVDDHQDGHLDLPEVTTSPMHVDMNSVEGLYDAEEPDEEAPEEAMPRFGRALASSSNNGRIQGLFVPDTKPKF
jgi:hypothetical protein